MDNLTYGQQSLFHLCANPRFEFVLGEVRDEGLMRSVVAETDVSIPLAAVVGAAACGRDPELARSVDVEGVRLLNRLRSRSQMVIFPTTNSGYGTKSDDTSRTEESALEPISLYGRTKGEAETELLSSPNAIALWLATVFGLSPHCFIHCIRNAEHMAGRAYNAGLDSANLSKEELACKVKEYVPNLYVHFASIGSDPGQAQLHCLPGGLGIRLRSVVKDRPKVLAEIRGDLFSLIFWTSYRMLE